MLESGQEDRIVQLDFSAAFDSVNHQRILYKLCSVEIAGFVLAILTQFLSNRSQYVMMDSLRSHMVNVPSGVPQGSVLGPLLFFLCTLQLLFIQENKLYVFANDFTFASYCVIPRHYKLQL